MKNTKLILSIVFSSLFILNASSQTPVTINQGDMPTSGSKYRFSTTVPMFNLNLDSNGNDQYWDYSDFMPLSQKMDTFETVSVFFTPYLAMGSTSAMQTIDSIMMIENFANGRPLFRNTSTQWFMNGFLPNDFPLPFLYEKPDVIYNFPLEFENKDTSDSRLVINIPGLIYYERNMTRINHADAWGTLTTPYGTFDVIRVVSVINQTDSVNYELIGIKFDLPEMLEYKWLGKEQGLPLLQVRVYNIDGALIPISVEYQDSLRVLPPSPPILLAPFNYEYDVSLIPAMEWSNVFNADSYRLQISKNMMFTNIVLDNSGITSNTFNLAAGLLEEGSTYFWRVYATNTAGTSNWSNIWQFSTAGIPLPPVLVSPANNASKISTMLTFNWEESEGASMYHFLLSEDQNFNTIVNENKNLTNSIYTFPGSLSNNTTYYWKVSAGNTSGFSDFSDTWSFTTQAASSVFENLMIRDQINVYPNPAKDQLNFKISQTSAGHVSVYITDALGRKVISVQNKNMADNENKIEVDVSKLKNGIYFYQVITENENWFGKVEMVNFE